MGSSSAKLWSLLNFFKCSSVWRKLWVWRELRSPPGTQRLQSRIYRLPGGLAVTCSPLWSLSVPWAPPVLPAPNPTLAVSPLQATVSSAGCKAGGFAFSIICCFLNYLLQLCWWSTQVVLLRVVSKCLQTRSQGQILILSASAKYSPLDWGPICVPVELYSQADCWLRDLNTAPLKDRHRFELCKVIKSGFFSSRRPHGQEAERGARAHQG